MAPRLPSRRIPPIGFAHRGARAHAPDNTLEAFALALRLGATGLHGEVWLTADGQAVLDADGLVGSRLRRRPIAETAAADLPGHIARLRDLYDECGTGIELSVDIKDPAAALEVIAVAREVGAEERLWLCHPDWTVVETWRELSPAAHLVESTRLSRFKEGPERHVATVAQAGLDAVALPQSDWSGGMIALMHRFELDALGTDAQFPRTIDELLDAGIDGVYSDHVDDLIASINRI